MTILRPPAVATWLLERLGSGTTRDALVGDLTEQYATRQSRGWYWRQVLTAIATSTLHDIYGHKFLAIRAVIAGCATFALLKFAGDSLYMSLGSWVWNWTVENGHDTTQLWWFTYKAPIAVGLAISCLGSGWAVARLNRDHAASMLATFVAFALLINVSAVWQALSRPMPFAGALLVQAAVQLLVMPMLILTGGLWSAAPDRTASPARGRAA